LQIVQELTSRNYEVIAYDPKAMETARAILGDSIKYAESAIAPAKGADALAVLTEWQDFKKVPLDKLEMRHKNIIDLRHMIDATAAKSAGFTYIGIGQ
jgi:UDPglucose 6-dehydrogenase